MVMNYQRPYHKLRSQISSIQWQRLFILDVVDGKISYDFKPAEMEGRLRAVALVVSETGLGMETAEITIQDPVSIDISLPRFVAPGDNIAGKIRLRSNSFNGEIELTRRWRLQTGERNIIK